LIVKQCFSFLFWSILFTHTFFSSFFLIHTSNGRCFISYGFCFENNPFNGKSRMLHRCFTDASPMLHRCFTE
jgi:hypothetical protein